MCSRLRASGDIASAPGPPSSYYSYPVQRYSSAGEVRSSAHGFSFVGNLARRSSATSGGASVHSKVRAVPPVGDRSPASAPSVSGLTMLPPGPNAGLSSMLPLAGNATPVLPPFSTPAYGASSSLTGVVVRGGEALEEAVVVEAQLVRPHSIPFSDLWSHSHGLRSLPNLQSPISRQMLGPLSPRLSPMVSHPVSLTPQSDTFFGILFPRVVIEQFASTPTTEGVINLLAHAAPGLKALLSSFAHPEHMQVSTHSSAQSVALSGLPVDSNTYSHEPMKSASLVCVNEPEPMSLDSCVAVPDARVPEHSDLVIIHQVEPDFSSSSSSAIVPSDGLPPSAS